MALTVRGRIMAALGATVVLVALILVVLVVGGSAGLGPLADIGSGDDNLGQSGPPVGQVPTHCPLTGVRPEEGVPNRPALAVKVENLPSARPQTGLSWADIVYEEPVEVRITRFIAIYQCQDASRIEPVRSARMTDPEILVQYGTPLLGYSGGVRSVVQEIRAAGIVDLSEEVVPQAYQRDPEREAPHDLYSSTQELYAAAGSPLGVPQPVFSYSERAMPGGRPVSEVFIPFSSYSDVSWRWSSAERNWIRYDSGEVHALSDGSQIASKNVIIQVVEEVLTDIVDVRGARSPKVVSTGSGVAYILRGGKMYTGTWEREGLAQITTFRTGGREVQLAPGNTWIELVPNDISVTSTPA
jgi:Protein of unknown function (DUF3048) N-terminal domain/Protein of unknown function (DUF3048) C-terminal domain